MSSPPLESAPKKFNQMPLVLGIVGQEQLGKLDPVKLGQGVREYLGELRRKYPDTPFLFLSPLAGEAEQLMAIEAMQFVADQAEKNPAEPGAELIVVLPVSYSLYKSFLPRLFSRRSTGCARKTALSSFPPFPLAISHQVRQVTRDWTP
jgi:hypothetical protein